MTISKMEIVVLVSCVFLYIAIIAYCKISSFFHERKLKKAEITAELEILSDKLCKQQQLRQTHL